MRLSVDHTTTYRFDTEKRGVIQSMRLTPSVYQGQTTVEWTIDTGEAIRGAAFRDGAGDWIETAKHLGPTSEAFVRVTGIIDTVDLTGVLTGHAEKVPPLSYLQTTRATDADVGLTDLAEKAVTGVPEERVLDRSHALMNAVADAIAYSPGQTQHGTTAAEALALGHGVCQDHAHAMIAVACVVGLPARYVTGYLFASEEDGGHEASHAWAEVFVPELGWVGFDPSNRICPDDRYIRIGSGGDAIEAAPIRGIVRGPGDENLDVRVTVNQAAQ
jgi:transglutaminase-like putative cysteine protease